MLNHNMRDDATPFTSVDAINQDRLAHIFLSTGATKDDLAFMESLGNNVASAQGFDVQARTLQVIRCDEMPPTALIELVVRSTAREAANLVFGMAERISCLDAQPPGVHLTFRTAPCPE